MFDFTYNIGKLFPMITMALNIGAVITNLWIGNYQQSLYWGSAFLISFSVVFMNKLWYNNKPYYHGVDHYRDDPTNQTSDFKRTKVSDNKGNQDYKLPLNKIKEHFICKK